MANDLVTVEMPDGTLITDVPRGTSEEEILKTYNKANGFASMEGFAPSSYTSFRGKAIEEGLKGLAGEDFSLADTIENFFAGLQKNVKRSPLGALAHALFREKEMLAPEFDKTGEFTGFKKLDRVETQKVRDKEAAIYYDIINAPDDGSMMDLMSEAGVHAIDPSTWIVGGLYAGERLSAEVAKRVGPDLVKQLVPSRMQRFMRVFAPEAALGGTNEALNQINEGKRVTELDHQKLMWRALAQGGLTASFDLAAGTMFQMATAAKGNPKKMNKLIDNFEDGVRTRMLHGKNKGAAIRATMRSMRTDMPHLQAAARQVDRNINFETQQFNRFTSEIKNKLNLTGAKIPQGLEFVITPLSSRIRDISEPVFRRLRKHDFEVAQFEAKYFDQIENWLGRGKIKGLGKLSGFRRTHTNPLTGRPVPIKEHFQGLVTNRDRDGIVRLAEELGDRRLVTYFDEMTKALDGIFLEYRRAGFDIKHTKNFFPRHVKDYNGLKAELGEKVGSQLDKALAKATREAGRPLSATEQSIVINKIIAGGGKPLASGPRHLRQRSIEIVPQRLLKYYDDVDQSLVRYIDDSAKTIARARFFGVQDTKTFKVGTPEKTLTQLEEEATALAMARVRRDFSEDAIDDTMRAAIAESAKKTARTRFQTQEKLLHRPINNIDDSLGAFLQKDLDKKNLTLEEVDNLKSMLHSRFVEGEVGPGRFLGGLRNIFYTLTLGQFPRSALTQVGDIGLSGYVNGMGNAIRGLLPKNRFVDVADFNLTRKVAEEFATTGTTATILKNVLKADLFKFTDKMGKTSVMNGAILNAQKAAKAKPGTRAWKGFEDKWKPVFGQEWASLVSDLQKGRITDNVKFLAFNQVADLQPINLSEMPQAYLNARGGRIFFMLKTFTIKQLDRIRRDAFREITSGDAVKGMTQLMRYSMMFGMTNMGVQQVKDWVRGREVEWEDHVVDAFWKNFGVSQYLIDKAGGGKISEAAASLIMPPLSTIDPPIEFLMNHSEDWGTRMNSLSESVPLVGQMYYDWFGGGIEEFNRRKALENRAERFKRPERESGQQPRGAVR